MPQTAIVKPDDQLQLSEKEMNEEFIGIEILFLSLR